MTRARRWLVLSLVVLVTIFVVPRSVAGMGANAYFDEDLTTEDALARTVLEGVLAQKGPTAYTTRNLRFDGQSTVAIHQMALLGLGQIVLAHPEKRDAYLPAMRAAAAHLADPATIAYAEEAYDDRSQAFDEGHAYLGYVNLGLSMLRLIEPDNAQAKLNDRLTDTLARRIAASKNGMIETYPGETWPPDVAAVIGSIGLHARATHADREEFLADWVRKFEPCAVHKLSGLLVQRFKSGTCEPADAPRGSGTAVATYFLSFATPAFAKRLYDAMSRELMVHVLGFGGISEYAPGFDGKGDLDAGPILFGVSVGGTGFALGAAKTQSDRDGFRALYRSTSLFGVPTSIDGRTAFAMGGQLGNALLLAMLTARPMP